MAHRLQYRRDTKANWLKYNPVLMEGEVGYETDTHHQKVGDGVSKYSELEYEVGVGNITQETGDSESLVMSQKAVSEKLAELGSYVNTNSVASMLQLNLSEYCTKGLFIREDGETIGSNRDYGYIYKIYCKGLKVIEFSRSIRRCLFYDTDGNVLGNVTDTNEVHIPENTCYISLNVVISNYAETKILGLIYDNYITAQIDNIQDLEDVEIEEYLVGSYVRPNGSFAQSETRIVYKINVTPLGIYNIVLKGLGDLATDVAFFAENDKFLKSTGKGNSNVKSKLVVAPKTAKYMLISAIQGQPLSVKNIIRTDMLSEYLDEISKIENEHYQQINTKINCINSFNDNFVSGGIELLEDSGFIRIEDGTKGTNDSFVCSKFLPIIPGSTIITDYTPGNTSGYAFYSEPNEESFISGTQQLTVIEVPNNALFFSF